MLYNLKHWLKTTWRRLFQVTKFYVSMISIHKKLFYQANQSVCIEDKIMCCCCDVTYKCMHSPNLDKSGTPSKVTIPWNEDYNYVAEKDIK